MLISIIIPAYNYAEYLGRGLQSILSQQSADCEIIVIDDGSTDNTQDIMQSYTQQYSHIHFFSQQRQGPGKARNLGARYALGKWLLFLDADDYLLPNALAIFKQTLQNNKTCKAVLAGHIKQDQYNRFKTIKGPRLTSSMEENFSNFIAEKLRLYQGAFIIRHDLFTALGGYPEDIILCEDKILWGRLIANHTIIAISAPVVYLCDHPGRLREDFQTRQKEALSYIALLFDPRYLPAHLQKYKNPAVARALMSLVKNYYQHGQYHQAMQTFYQALKKSLYVSLQFRTLKYYLLALIKIILQRQQTRDKIV
jgi:glycosyltransferase involved in cell wall biosynthesis